MFQVIRFHIFIPEMESESSGTEAENIRVIPDSSQVEEKLPDLPVKNGYRLSNICHDYDKHLDCNNQDHFENKICSEELISIDTCTNMELDSLLFQLTALNNECDKSHKSLEFNNNTVSKGTSIHMSSNLLISEKL